MKSLLLIISLFPFLSYAQPGVVIRNDTAFMFDPATGLYTQVTKQDTSALPRFTDKVKGLITWSNVQGKPSSYSPSSHTHVIADITNFGSYANATHTHVKADISDFGTYAASSHTHAISDVTSLQASLDAKLTDPARPPTSSYRLMIGNNTLNFYAVRTVNGYDIANGNITLAASDVGAQPLDADLTTISGLTATTDNFLVASASAWASRTPAQVKTTLSLDNVTNTSDANKPVSTAQQTALDLKANAASPALTGNWTSSGKITNYNSVATVSNGVPSIVAEINATAQAANIATSTLYAVPSAGFYRVSIYITVTQAATTSSTMPSTTITYTDGNAGTNAHSTTTTATNASNSVTTSFAQTTYVLYAKASTNIQYATGSYASSGGTPMQYALRIRVEAL